MTASHVDVKTPRFAGRARVTGCCVWNGALAFRADGGPSPGIWTERDGEDASPLLMDQRGAMHLNATWAGPLLAAHRLTPGSIPPVVESVAFLHDGAEALVVPGQSVGVSADGRRAVVVDVVGQALHAVDLGAATTRVLARIDGRMHPIMPPVPALAPDGSAVVWMDASSLQCDGRLEYVSWAETGRRTLIPALEAPGRVCAAFLPGGNLVVLRQELAGRPRCSVAVLTADGRLRLVFEKAVNQALTPPAAASDDVVYAALTVQTAPGEGFGPLHLCRVDLARADVKPLAEIGGGLPRLRMDGPSVLAEGMSEVMRVG